MRHSRQIGRVAAVAAMLVAVAAVAVVLLGDGGEDYRVVARFQNASQLVEGNNVQVAGVPVGSVERIDLADDGRAEVTLNITKEGYAPLRQGTKATIRLASLSGVANRYVDLRLGGADGAPIEDGGALQSDDTTSAVELDQLFNTFDRRTRKSLQGVIRGFGRQIYNQSEEADRGWQYLNPSLAASSRFFEELTYDTPAFEEFILASSKLVTDVAERRDDLAGLIDRLAVTLGAIGSRKEALADAIETLPPFMRRANTTFVNLRAALDDLRPLVEESKPVARKLRPFFAELRPLARDARPTLRDFSNLIRREGKDNDLIELTRGQKPLRDVAVGPVRAHGKVREGALPAGAKALRRVTPQMGFFRPYAVDLTGWFDDFGRSGLYDALGGKSRVGTYVNAFGVVDGVLRPIAPELRTEAFQNVAATKQRNRCPGAAERPADDGSNPWKPHPDFNCDPDQTLGKVNP